MPGWKHSLRVQDVFHDEEMSFEEKRDKIVARIKALPMYDTDYDLQDLTEELSITPDVYEFDHVWDAFYDWADAERVWVSTV